MFTLAAIGPALGAVTNNHEKLPSLILPKSTFEAIKDFREAEFYITYIGYDLAESEQTLRALFSIENPYHTSISITSVRMHCYCHEHGTYFGPANGEDLPVDIPAKSLGTLSIVLHFNEDAKNDVLHHYNANEALYLDLKNLEVSVQGVEISYTGDVTKIGPISLT